MDSAFEFSQVFAWSLIDNVFQMFLSKKSRAELSPTTVEPTELNHLFQSIFLEMFYPENVLYYPQNQEFHPGEIR